MKIKCVHCSSEFDVADYIEKGQDVLCPYCVRHFSYGEQKDLISEADLQAAIQVCCRDKKQDEYYMKAPCGARLHIALIFYGKVYKDTLNQNAYMALLEHVSKNELKERDLLYLFQYEEDEELKKHWLDRLVSEYGYDEVIDRSQTRYAVEKENGRRKFARSARPGQSKMVDVRIVNTSPHLKAGQPMNANRREKTSNIVLMACSLAIIAGLVVFLSVQFMRPDGSNSALQKPEQQVSLISEDKETSAKPSNMPVSRKAENERSEKLSALCRKIVEEVGEMQSACTQARKVLREDAVRFQHELNELSALNNFRAGQAVVERRQRLGNAEYAMMIAKSGVVAELYARYAKGELKLTGDNLKSETLHLLSSSDMKTGDIIAAIEKKADLFMQATIKSINDGISVCEREMWDADKFVRRVLSTAKQSEAMLRLGSLSETERLLESIEQEKWQRFMATLESMPMTAVATAYGEVGPDEFTVCDDARHGIESDRSGYDVQEGEIADHGNQEHSVFALDASPDKEGLTGYEDIPASTKPKMTSRPHVQASAADKKRRRSRCKSPERCNDFAEVGQNFCEAHRCQSYGCKEHRATLTIPAWFDTGKHDRVTGSSIKRNFRKLRIPYCKRHMCQRTVIQPSDRKAGGLHGHYWHNYDSTRFGAEFFFCTNERLSKCKYCSEHVCKVPTCSAPRWEYWVEASAEKIDEREFRGRLPTSLTEFRGLRLKRMETCKGHSAMDPDAIRDRTEDELQTEGDQKKARESGN